MIKSSISVDLPSIETERRKHLFDQLRELFGVKVNLRDGFEELTVSAFSLLDGVCNALWRAQVSDAISLIVDKKVIYLDTNNVTSDVGWLWQAAKDRGVLSGDFTEMHVAFAHSEAGLAVIIDLRVEKRVLRGTAEMKVELSARPGELVVRQGESAQAYADRVTRFAQDQNTIAMQRSALDAITHRISNELGRALPGSRVFPWPARVELIRQESKQLSRFGQLGWGVHTAAPHYRPVPTQSRTGAYSDPFYYYWYDPYWDFAHYLMLDAVLHHGGWHSPEVVVVNPAGQQLYSSDHADHYRADPNFAPSVVAVGHEGVAVNDSGTHDGGWGGSDVGSGSSGHTGWGGSDTHDHGWGGSDTSSSDTSGSSCSSSSSCGSSCSGSSCGSSCGGGGGGD